LFGSQKEKNFLVLDIGTEAVKALAAEKNREDIVIEGAALSYFDEFGVFDSRNFKKDVSKKAVLTVLKDIQRTSGCQLKKAILTLSPDILKARIIKLTFKREKGGEKINRQERERIRRTVLAEAKKRICREQAEKSGILPKELHFVRSEILETKIDGYSVKELTEYNGKSLEFSVFAAFLPKGYLHELQEISRELDLEILKIIHSAEILGKVFSGESGVFLDIGGEVTQLMLLKEGNLLWIDEFGIGGEHFSQALSDSLGLLQEQARVLKESYSERELGEQARQRIEEIVHQALSEWLSGLRSKMDEYKSLMPPSLYLFGGGSQLFDIKEALAEQDELLFIGSPRIQLASLGDLPHIKNNFPYLKVPQFFNSILASYATKEKNI